MKKKKILWSVLAGVFALSLCVCLFFLWKGRQPQIEIPDPVPPVVEEPEPVLPDPVPCPVNFEELKEQNPHIYAWLQIPGTTIDYPVLQHPENDGYYMDHALDGKYLAAGCLFTEKRYNNLDFSDPVTVVYGHHMYDGSMFGNLQEHFSNHQLGNEDIIYIYTPTVRKTFRVFGGIPHESTHILHYHNFFNRKDYENFFTNELEYDNLYANTDPNLRPKFGESVLILSTCQREDRTHRFLVLGIQVKEEPIIVS